MDNDGGHMKDYGKDIANGKHHTLIGISLSNIL